MRTGSSRFAVKVLAVGAVYAAAARLGLMVEPVGGFATLVWPPTGIALAVVLLWGYRFWPGVAAGALVANASAGAPIAVALGIACGNTLEAVVGAYLVRRFGGVGRSIETLRHVIALVLLGAAASTAISATVGVASLVVGRIVSPAEAFETWRAWWVGDALGALVVTPLLLAWFGTREARPTTGRTMEATALAVTLVFAGLLVFAPPATSGARDFLAAHLLVPFLLYAALRFRMRGATGATALISAVAVWETVQGHGPFAGESLPHSLLLLQVFMAVSASTVLVLAAVMTERAVAIRRREELVAIAAHDLRSPLSVIRMASAAIRRQTDPGGGGATAHAAAAIERSVDRMNLLIRDLLDMAALQDGLLSLDPRPHDAGAIATETAELMRPLAAQKALTLNVELPATSVEVTCDRERILQALANLVGNALKFTPPGGVVGVAVEELEREVRFTVSDSGPGIPPEELPHIFDRFWRAHGEGAAPGVGLGLSIVKGLAAAHGGSVSVESRVGVGSAFRLSLPLTRANDDRHGEAALPSTDGIPHRMSLSRESSR